jgi:hypothetical protein
MGVVLESRLLILGCDGRGELAAKGNELIHRQSGVAGGGEAGWTIRRRRQVQSWAGEV